MIPKLPFIFLIFLVSPACLWAKDFFEVENIKRIRKEPKDKIGVWAWETNANNRPTITGFRDCIEVTISVKENIPSKGIIAKAYFFDDSGTLLEKVQTPALSGSKTTRPHFAMPVFFNKDIKERIFFAIPESIKNQRWTVLVVFGDQHEVVASTYPRGMSYTRLDFPEKSLLNNPGRKNVKRKKVLDKVVEHVVKTKNTKHPQITLFLRPPAGVEDWSEVQGVLALVVLAPGVEHIRRRMQSVEIDGDEAGTFAFANKHKLAILAWGARRVWDPRRNYDDYDRKEAREMERDFDDVADAWERGIEYFHKEYDLPVNNFLIRGSSGAAQWAKRLCLRKPDYFLAIFVHVPSSFDRPTLEASKVLWCVTTGELESGYERSLRFFKECRSLGYPILYKAIPGLGHAAHPHASALGNAFFEYAISFKKEREKYDRQTTSTSSQMTPYNQMEEKNLEPWPKAFATPLFYGDIVNQEVFPAKEVDMIPAEFRVGIPTKKLADIWKQDAL